MLHTGFNRTAVQIFAVNITSGCEVLDGNACLTGSPVMYVIRLTKLA